MGPFRQAPTYDLTRWIFLRGLGLVYAIAFTSLAVQLPGLVGDEGIVPAGRFLTAVEARHGGDAPWVLPTVAWAVGTDTAMLVRLAWSGVVSGALLALGVAPALAAATSWVLYLSLVGVGQAFLAFQWDALLLEAGMLGILLAPGGIRPGLGAHGPARPLVWLCWLLVFKLHVLSGAVKLLSGDPAWWSLRALESHYWTTCLPTWTGWWAHQLPAIVHRGCVLAMFVIELGAPCAILFGRHARRVAAALLIALQLAIAATGNYGFFNLLTIVLCFTLVDDAAFAASCASFRSWIRPPPPTRVRARVAALLALVVAILSVVPMAQRLGAAALVPGPLRDLHARLDPLRSFNAYGLFATMTTRRPEIVVEGTLDGVTWRPYSFRWKPGDPTAPPRFAQPHMPRLDWQMWFAALQGPRRAWWFGAFLHRLHAGSADVLALLASDPFDGRRPLAVRALLYRYRFTGWRERRQTGAWWWRELLGSYAGPIGSSAQDGQQVRHDAPHLVATRIPEMLNPRQQPRLEVMHRTRAIVVAEKGIDLPGHVAERPPVLASQVFRP